jgi:hypothetical protein
MVNISSPFEPSPLREGRRRTATVTSVEVVREIKTAFIPIGTNAVPSVVPPGLGRFNKKSRW